MNSLYKTVQQRFSNYWTPLLASLAIVSLIAIAPASSVPLSATGNLPPAGPLFSTVAQEDEPGDGDEEQPEERGIVGLVEVVVARADIPIGERFRPELVEIEQRPSNNVAVRAGVTFNEVELIVGQIAKTHISEGQAILAPMVALSSTDLAGFGSDLSLFVDRQDVAVAFPISSLSGTSFAMRPGDFIDVLMSFNLIELDVEFQTALPNRLERVDEEALRNGAPFLFPATVRGRLEVIPELGNAIVQITPQGLTIGEQFLANGDGLDGSEEAPDRDTSFSASELNDLQIPRRVTQLTVQQAEVLWVGTWDRPYLGVNAPSGSLFANELTGGRSTTLNRSDILADVVILSLPVQDALVLKWALEEPGADVDLALRSQGDNAVYFTTSVSLPQLVEQAGLSIPEPGQFDLQPRLDGSDIPRLPAVSPEDTKKDDDNQGGNNGNDGTDN